MAIDVGTVNGSPFFNVAGVGFDAHVAHLFNKRAQGRRGRLPYVVIGVREGCRYVAKTYAVTLDGSRIESKALLIVFANGREFGSGAQIAPQAKLDDGLLDASIIEDRPVVSRFLHARHLAFGSIERAPRIIRRPVQSAMVEADGTIAYHLDGEPRLAEGRLEVAIKPGALVVKV
jgi:diacylglycerol kinase (ATP)